MQESIDIMAVAKAVLTSTSVEVMWRSGYSPSAEGYINLEPGMANVVIDDRVEYDVPAVELRRAIARVAAEM